MGLRPMRDEGGKSTFPFRISSGSMVFVNTAAAPCWLTEEMSVTSPGVSTMGTTPSSLLHLRADIYSNVFLGVSIFTAPLVSVLQQNAIFFSAANQKGTLCPPSMLK